MSLIIKIYYIFLPVIASFHMKRTDNFFWIPSKGTEIYERLCVIYDINNPNMSEDNNINLVNSINRITKLEKNIPKESKTLMMEGHHFGNYNICCFLGTIEANNYTVYDCLLLNKEKDTRYGALKELNYIYNLDVKYISNKKWYLDYLFDK